MPAARGWVISLTLGREKSDSRPFATADNTLYAITVDAAGNAYLAGGTDDPNFPATPGSYQPVSQFPNQANSGFVAKLNPTGSAMVWATYFGRRRRRRPLPSMRPAMCG